MNEWDTKHIGSQMALDLDDLHTEVRVIEGRLMRLGTSEDASRVRLNEKLAHAKSAYNDRLIQERSQAMTWLDGAPFAETSR